MTTRQPSPEEREHTLRGMQRTFWLFVLLAAFYFALPIATVVFAKQPFGKMAYFQLATAVIWALVALREYNRIRKFREKGYF